MNAIILPYKNGSRSSAALANALGVRQIRLSGSTINRQRGKSIINWGNSGRNLPPQGLGRHHTIVNSCHAVSDAADKLRTFNVLGSSSTRIPEYTTEFEIACEWLEEGSKVVERHQLTGHSGAGINIVEELDGLSSQAPLYVKYIKKQDEYRVHIMGGQVIDVQRKARRSDVPDEDVNWQVRNHQNGFCYMRENVNPDTDVIVQALNAIEALGLDFGAVDVIWNAHQSKAYVLEVNTACGLEGTTLERYKVAFQELLMLGEVTPLEGYSIGQAEEDDEPVDEDRIQLPTQPRQELTPETLRVGTRLRALQSMFFGTALEEGDVVSVTYVGGRGFMTTTEVSRGTYSFRDSHLNGEYFELVDDGVVQEEQGVQEFDMVTPSTSSQVTPPTAPLSKWLVAVDGNVNLEEGVFDTQEEAEMALVSPDFHNMRQLGHNVRVVSL